MECFFTFMSVFGHSEGRARTQHGTPLNLFAPYPLPHFGHARCLPAVISPRTHALPEDRPGVRAAETHSSLTAAAII